MPRLPTIAIAAAALCLAACDSGNPHERVELVAVPESWDVVDVVVLEIQWFVINPDSLPIECGDTEAAGCTVFSKTWPHGPCAFGAADPREWGWETPTGQRREGTVGHEMLHCAFGSFHE